MLSPVLIATHGFSPPTARSIALQGLLPVVAGDITFELIGDVVRLRVPEDLLAPNPYMTSSTYPSVLIYPTLVPVFGVAEFNLPASSISQGNYTLHLAWPHSLSLAASKLGRPPGKRISLKPEKYVIQPGIFYWRYSAKVPFDNRVIAWPSKYLSRNYRVPPALAFRGGMLIAQVDKSLSSVLDYTIDWREWLGNRDAITSSTWAWISNPANLSITAERSSRSSATAWLSGGLIDQVSVLRNTVVTAQGRTETASIGVKVVAN